MLDGLWSDGAYTGGKFSVSASGDLLYVAGRVQGMSRFLAILDRNGEATTWSDDRLDFDSVWVSPDGRRLAVQVDNISEGDALLQIRVSDFERPRLVTVGAQPGKDCGSATWSTDSRSIAYLCWDEKVTTLYATPIQGASSPRLLLEESAPIALELAGVAAGDASVLLLRLEADGSMQLVSVPFQPPAGSDPTVQRIPMEEQDWSRPALSPDGRWLAYIANEAGKRGLFVREVLGETSVGPRILASAKIGAAALWSKSMRAGRYELLFDYEGQHFSVEVVTEPSVQISESRKLDYDPFFLGIRSVDSLPDGRLVIVRAPDTELGSSELRLFLNWTQRLAMQGTASRE